MINSPSNGQLTVGHQIEHLYVHVPFCPSICPYCDFHVLRRQGNLVANYLAELEREAAQLAQQYDPTSSKQLVTVYLGGGTPSFLRDSEMVQLVQSVQQNLGWGNQENTLEVNPNTVTPQRARLWRELGFDRASVGVQSLDDATLKFLGRNHNAKQAMASLEMLLEAGFAVSGDLITAVAGQPLAKDISILASLGISHISAYTLTIEPGTEFARRGVSVSEEDERLGFEQAAELLEDWGFERYEVSNYARIDQKITPYSQHNLAYWQGRLYYGLGPSAAGHYPSHKAGSLSQRRTNPPLSEWLIGQRGQIEDIGQLDYVTDALFMGLRLHKGLNLADLSSRSGINVAEYYASTISRHVERGLLLHQGDNLRATPAGWWVLNKVLLDFLENS